MLCLTVSGQQPELLWEDNFNTGRLDSSYWNIETGTGVNGDFGTGQIDRATGRAGNISFSDSVPGAEDGCLVISTRKEFYIDRNYTSGRINTAGKASWGPGHRIVARIFPRDVKQMGQGFAFWMMPDEIPAGQDYIMWPQGGEIDIMEYVGAIPFHNLGSVHYAWFWNNNRWADWNHGHKGAYFSYESGAVPLPAEPGYGNYPPADNDVNAGSHAFHTYGIDWYSKRIEFFVDDKVYHIHYLNDGSTFAKDGEDDFAIRETGQRRVAYSEYSNHFGEWHPFEHKMYPILSAGVGGSQHTYGGAIVPAAEFPCSVFIDWVRVYKLETGVGVNETAAGSAIDIYPNPASDVLTIRSSAPGDFVVRVSDASGKMLREYPGKQLKEIDVSAFAKGSYLVTLLQGGRLWSKQVVIL